MKTSLWTSTTILLFTLIGSAAAFEQVWTDQYGETSYSITAPDSVVVGQEFIVTITAADPIYPGDMIAAPWNFQVDEAIVDNGFGIFLSAGAWSEVYSFSYDAPGEHGYLFTAQDLGHGGGAHNWEWFEISGITHVVDLIPVAESSWSRFKRLY